MRMSKMLLTALVMLPLGGIGLAADDVAPKPPEIRKATADDAKHFFNGKDLTGWWGEPGLWKVENGEIVGKTETGLKRNEFLKSAVSVGDFRLVCKIKLVPDEGNSGIQFHSVVHEGNEMAGPQADAGEGWWGKLYGENLFGGKLISEVSGEPYLHPNEWNTYEIVAVGSKFRTAFNGHLTTDVDNPKIPQTGIFGLQIHAGGPTEVRFKDIELELNPKFELKTLASQKNEKP